MSMLTGQEQQKLLRWARQVIEDAVAGRRVARVGEDELTPGLIAPHAAFVTLKKHGQLRGCIGHMDYSRPLWKNVLKAAVSSALEDPRFPPVTADELASIRLEISVLEPPRDIPDASLFDAQRHGIIVERGRHHALLLPKVAREYGWDEHKTLETVCLKAGLPADAWREPDIRLQVFEAFDFAEESE
jgi:AmmeMemoRadiSam system protein A